MNEKRTIRYEVKPDGRVISYSGWRGNEEGFELSQFPNAYGYPSVRLVVNGKRKHVTVHSLVARAFHGEQPAPGYEVRHLDGNKTNNHFTNLAWGTTKQNADDRFLHGRTSRGEKHSAAIRASNQKQNACRGKNHYKVKAAIAKATE